MNDFLIYYDFIKSHISIIKVLYRIKEDNVVAQKKTVCGYSFMCTM